jgi:hypothetical protein
VCGTTGKRTEDDMIYTDLKYQGKTPLDYQCALNLKNESQERKINLFWGWIPVEWGLSQGKGE